MGISDTLLKQRLRNRLIESLDAFVDEETVSVVGTDEIIECWYDYMDEDRLAFYDEPVFSSDEINAIKLFHNLLESSYQKVPSTWKIEELKECAEWSTLVTAACEAYSIFLKRGFFDEE
ncbi:hypothetical protein H0A36_13910 [Endozoicomonas sp. SM1973]|uniref:Uncharacterized protein n=1 Tax=Spartinivicinus marinus TaxID=2994442 RepID=A0A853IB98_9GAMM|nr:hypothetical protein [Spartinivicinus marinus]MCX4028623.1 hypothetical protein [Spartinivicinus marinus]NYZ67111.1 hypothetical protein [Spartinivicinus marinus]